MKNIYLIGLGAIGGVYAGIIHENCPESLQVVADCNRIEKYKKSEIKINGKSVNFKFISPGENDTKADLILIAVKQHHLKQTIEDIRSLVDPDTIILSLLNGISSEEIIGREYGMDKMLYSFVVGTDAVRTGTEIKFTNTGKIVFGDKFNSRESSKVKAVRAFFDEAKVPYTIPENMMREQWWKFMMNVGINQVSAILKAPYGPFMSEGCPRELMLAASREVIAISEKAGFNLCEDDLQTYLRILGTFSPDGKTSMFQDVEAGRKTEVEIFAGTVIELGSKYGVKTPVNDILFKIIKSLEQISGIEQGLK